jgi:hypothetical protein
MGSERKPNRMPAGGAQRFWPPLLSPCRRRRAGTTIKYGTGVASRLDKRVRLRCAVAAGKDCKGGIAVAAVFRAAGPGNSSRGAGSRIHGTIRRRFVKDETRA